jgi:hypothetical protein
MYGDTSVSDQYPRTVTLPRDFDRASRYEANVRFGYVYVQRLTHTTGHSVSFLRAMEYCAVNLRLTSLLLRAPYRSSNAKPVRRHFL